MIPRAPSPAFCSSVTMSSYEPTFLNVLDVPTPLAMCCFQYGLDIASPGTRSTACASFATPASCLSTACTQLWQLLRKPQPPTLGCAPSVALVIRNSGLVWDSSGNSRVTTLLPALPACTAVEPSPVAGLPLSAALAALVRSSPSASSFSPPTRARSPATRPFSPATAALTPLRPSRIFPPGRNVSAASIPIEAQDPLPVASLIATSMPSAIAPAATANGARNCSPGTSDSTPRTADTPLRTVEICGQHVRVLGDPALDRAPGPRQPARLLVRRVRDVADGPRPPRRPRPGARRAAGGPAAITSCRSEPTDVGVRPGRVVLRP